MIELIGSIVTVIALAGAWLNNRHKISCFYLWIVSNLLSAGIHAWPGLWSLTVRDLAFLVLAIEGIWRWRKKDKGLRYVIIHRNGQRIQEYLN
jgi:nicotinamide riboside transporter PnuC